MLFNSFEFIFIFLPITLLIFFLVGRRGYYKIALTWLVAASLFFYGWWNPAYLGLLVFSLLFNYCIGVCLSDKLTGQFNKKMLLALGIAVNISLIAYFKYENFFVSTINDLVGTSFNLNKIILPLGISFFTFEQIAFLVDVYRGITKESSLLNYALFVTFFPRLIAGPIILHRETMPQFANKSIYRFNPEDMAVGITIFSLGLFKKVVFADKIAVYATPVFDAAAQGASLTFFDAWVGALAYSLQLYFDFSGYSDMAIGAARMFGIKLPLNFNSPYKAVNIINFWRQWHITLSNFLRDYLYIPLGGNRKGALRRNSNLMITMLLGGLWHGAGWNFVLWGGLHGTYLIINNQWRSFRKSLGHDLKKNHWWSRVLGCLVTFLAVVVGWVFFRAENMNSAFAVLKGMIGANGVSLPISLSTRLAFLHNWGVRFEELMPTIQLTNPNLNASEAIILISSLFLVIWLIPNTQQWIIQHNPVLDTNILKNSSGLSERLWQKFQWQPNIICGIILGVLIFITMKVAFQAPASEFLYFNF